MLEKITGLMSKKLTKTADKSAENKESRDSRDAQSKEAQEAANKQLALVTKDGEVFEEAEVMDPGFDFQYVKAGNNWRQIEKGVALEDELEGGIIYKVAFNPFTGFSLNRQPGFKLPKKIYGNIQSRATRVLKAFNYVTGNLGALLCGLKGTGKSLLAQVICVQSGLPVVILDEDYTDGAKAGLLEFLTKIAYKQPVVFFFDEFEKNFDKDGQGNLLTLIEGGSATKAIYLLTANDISKINDNLRGRPGRIRYSWTYYGIGMDEVSEIVHDRIRNKAKAMALIQIFDIIDDNTLTPDKVTKFIDEVNNNPNEKISALLDGFNILTGPNSHTKTYDVEVTFKSMTLFKGTTHLDPLNFDGQFQMKYFSSSYKVYRLLADPFSEAAIEQLLSDDYAFDMKLGRMMTGSCLNEEGKKAINLVAKSKGYTEEQHEEFIDSLDLGQRNFHHNWLSQEDLVRFDSNELVYAKCNGQLEYKFTPMVPKTRRTTNLADYLM